MHSLCHGRQVPLLICLLLLILILVVFWQVQDHHFFVLDDHAYIVENPHVLSGLGMENIKWAFTTSHASYWHPLVWMSHMLDSHLYGLNPKGHHLNSVLLHMLSSLLYLSQGKLTDAVRHYSEAVCIDSKFAQARQNLIRALEKVDGGGKWNPFCSRCCSGRLA